MNVLDLLIIVLGTAAINIPITLVVVNRRLQGQVLPIQGEAQEHDHFRLLAERYAGPGRRHYWGSHKTYRPFETASVDKSVVAEGALSLLRDRSPDQELGS